MLSAYFRNLLPCPRVLFERNLRRTCDPFLLVNRPKPLVFYGEQVLGKGEVRSSILRGSTIIQSIPANVGNLFPRPDERGNTPLKRRTARCPGKLTRRSRHSPVGERMNGFDFYTVARFWSKVSVGRPTECWTWAAANSDAGYGRFKIAGKLESPHRLAYTMYYGENLQGEGYHGNVVMHTCDNPRCVNPAHLQVGTQSDNMQDCVAKGRIGEGAHKGRKLTPEQAAAIAADPRPIREVGRIYGISRTHVCRLRQLAKQGVSVSRRRAGGEAGV